MKSLMTAELWIDRQTAMTKITVVLHSLANASNNGSNSSRTKIFTKSVLW